VGSGEWAMESKNSRLRFSLIEFAVEYLTICNLIFAMANLKCLLAPLFVVPSQLKIMGRRTGGR
jgi:hypothetical protein